jgi:hypothetical protein
VMKGYGQTNYFFIFYPLEGTGERPTPRGMRCLSLNRGVWQGVAMDSQKYH